MRIRNSDKADLVGGLVPSAELPSYVDDVLDFPSNNDFPQPGEEGKIYLAKDTNMQYRYDASGGSYVLIGGSGSGSVGNYVTLIGNQTVAGEKTWTGAQATQTEYGATYDYGGQQQMFSPNSENSVSINAHDGGAYVTLISPVASASFVMGNDGVLHAPADIRGTDPTQPDGLATMQYVDNAVANGGGGGGNYASLDLDNTFTSYSNTFGPDQNKVSIFAGTGYLTPELHVQHTDGQDSQQAVLAKSYLQFFNSTIGDVAILAFTPLGTGTSNLEFAADHVQWNKAPTLPTDLTNMQYVTKVLTSKADLVSGKVPLAQLPYKAGANITIAADGTIASTAAGGGGPAAVLYTSTGQATDGAMTQKATSDELALRAPIQSPYFTGYPSAPDQQQGVSNGYIANTRYVNDSPGRLKSLYYSQPVSLNDLTIRNGIVYYCTTAYTTVGVGSASSFLFDATKWTQLPSLAVITTAAVQSAVIAGTYVNGVMTTVPTGSAAGMRFFNASYVYEYMRNDDTASNPNNYVWVRCPKG